MDCPNCGHHIAAIFVAGSLARSNKGAGRKKVERECPKGCGQFFGAREMKEHLPRCDGQATKAPAVSSSNG